MTELEDPSRFSGQSPRGSTLGWVLLFGGLFWAFSYLALTVEAEMDPGNAPFFSERRFVMTCIGAAFYAGVIGTLKTETRRQRAVRNVLLILSAIPTALLLLSLQLVLEKKGWSGFLSPENVDWTLVWGGSFAAGLVTWVTLRSKAKRYANGVQARQPSLAAAADTSFGNLPTRYSAENAAEYEERRRGPKWAAENAAVERLLLHVPEGSKVLDAPIGTGRFLPWFKSRGYDICGLDASLDMLDQASVNAQRVGVPVELHKGDILAIAAGNESFDLALCIRFLNLIEWPGVEAVMGELNRVSRQHIIVGVRYLPSRLDFGSEASSLLRVLMRLVRTPEILARRRDLVYHGEQSLLALFKRLDLRLVSMEPVERRWDGTDYAIMLLAKEPKKPVLG